MDDRWTEDTSMAFENSGNCRIHLQGDDAPTLCVSAGEVEELSHPAVPFEVNSPEGARHVDGCERCPDCERVAKRRRTEA